MRVGIVIPSFRTARFIADAIDSVLGQGYPDLRCLVMDGGSQDGTVEILRSYGDRIEWVSERDKGQADAIEKGFRRLSDCEVVGWLNSDDRLLPRAVELAARELERDPGVVLVHGDVERVDAFGRLFDESRSVDLDWETMRSGRGRVVQPGSFYRREAVLAAGGVDPSFHLLMDVDLWIRLLAQGRARRLPVPLAQFRVHEDAKSSARSPLPYYRESLRIARIHERDRLVPALVRRAARIPVHHVRHVLTGVVTSPRVPAPLGTPAQIHLETTMASAHAASLRAAGFVIAARKEMCDLRFVDAATAGASVDSTPFVLVGDGPAALAHRAAFVVSPHRPVSVPEHRWAPPSDEEVWRLAARIGIGENPISVWTERNDSRPAFSGAPRA